LSPTHGIGESLVLDGDVVHGEAVGLVDVNVQIPEKNDHFENVDYKEEGTSSL
jgi:hypothetical protein